jgi:hypothetical protein
MSTTTTAHPADCRCDWTCAAITAGNEKRAAATRDPDVARQDSIDRGRAALAAYRTTLDIGCGPEVQAASLVTDLLHLASTGEVEGFHGEPLDLLDRARESYAQDVTGEW